MSILSSALSYLHYQCNKKSLVAVVNHQPHRQRDRPCRCSLPGRHRQRPTTSTASHTPDQLARVRLRFHTLFMRTHRAHCTTHCWLLAAPNPAQRKAPRNTRDGPKNSTQSSAHTRDALDTHTPDMNFRASVLFFPPSPMQISCYCCCCCCCAS